MQLSEMSPNEQQSRRDTLQAEFDALKEQQLSLDLTRGKPSAAQLDLSNDLDGILAGFYLLQDGTDVRNYGGITGIPEAREFGAAMLGATPSEVLVGGNSSLTLMFNCVAHMIDRWRASAEMVKFLCPVPGYDRHFTICEHFDIEMINIPMTDDGPDMDQVETLVAEDPAIKGIWCVPRYSNPTGTTYSDAVVKRCASLGNSAGPDFRVFWDNAYAVHHVTDTPDPLTDIMPLARQAGRADSIFMFASTSKITFAGAGVAFVAMSEANLKAFADDLGDQTIGADKVNQLRHVRFLKDLDGLKAHMDRHRELLAPRFALVQEKLAPLGELGIATWTQPNGGYFVSLDTAPGLAARVVGLAGELGVKLTPAGATFPYGKDPEDRNIRIAPTFPGTAELEQALTVLVLCVELAALIALTDA